MQEVNFIDTLKRVEGPRLVGQEMFYQPGESLFASAAPGLVELGWSVFPQERSGGRMPGKVAGQVICWSKEHDLKNMLPTPLAMRSWRAYCATLNVACVMCPAPTR